MNFYYFCVYLSFAVVVSFRPFPPFPLPLCFTDSSDSCIWIVCQKPWNFQPYRCCRLLLFYSGTHCYLAIVVVVFALCLNKTKLVYPFLLSNISGYSRVSAAMTMTKMAKDASWQ